MVAPRANWKGFIKFSEVASPVAPYTAASSSERTAFNRLNRKTGNRVKRDKGTEPPGASYPAGRCQIEGNGVSDAARRLIRGYHGCSPQRQGCLKLSLVTCPVQMMSAIRLKLLADAGRGHEDHRLAGRKHGKPEQGRDFAVSPRML